MQQANPGSHDSSGISKLMFKEDAEDELREMDKIKAITSTIPNHEKYFLLSKFHSCIPKPLQGNDLDDFDKKCNNFIKSGISGYLINKNLKSNNPSGY